MIPGLTKTSATPATTLPARLSTKSPSFWAWDIPAARSSTASHRTAIPGGEVSSSADQASRPSRKKRRQAQPAILTRIARVLIFLTAESRRRSCVTSKRTTCSRPWKRDARRWLNIPKPKMEDYLAHCDKLTLDLVASFQRAMVEDLVGRTLAAARLTTWLHCL